MYFPVLSNCHLGQYDFSMINVLLLNEVGLLGHTNELTVEPGNSNGLQENNSNDGTANPKLLQQFNHIRTPLSKQPLLINPKMPTVLLSGRIRPCVIFKNANTRVGA